jgi:1,4-alpha-glucan branching enzyme
MNTTLETEFRPTVLPRRYSAERTLHHVDFYCDAPGAAHVCLVGDFNGWDMAATPLRRMPDGRWMASLELHHGHHQYLFVVDGEHRLDPKANGIARNDQNERVSLIAVS